MSPSRIPLGTIPGQLYLASLADMATESPDNSTGADLVVCLVEPSELEPYPRYADWIASSPQALHFPIVDHGVRPLQEMQDLGAVIADKLQQGERVVIHCYAGLGRSSLVATMALGALGYRPADALDTVRTARPGAGPESTHQHAFIRELPQPGPART